jgi:hypothetical protein
MRRAAAHCTLTPPPRDLSPSSSTPLSEICHPHPRLLHRAAMSSASPPSPVVDLGDAATTTIVDASPLGASASSLVDVDTSLTTSTTKTVRTRARASHSDV